MNLLVTVAKKIHKLLLVYMHTMAKRIDLENLGGLGFEEN